MLMTKESADKMRCPMALNGTGTCVGPGCAMWRWIVGYCGLAGKPLEAPTILGRE